MMESSLIPCRAVGREEDRIAGRNGLVSGALWRCSTGQKGALLLQRAVERVTMNLRAAADGRAEWVGFSRWLNNPSVTAEAIAVHSAAAAGRGADQRRFYPFANLQSQARSVFAMAMTVELSAPDQTDAIATPAPSG